MTNHVDNSLGALAVEKRLQQWQQDNTIARIWMKHRSLWSTQQDAKEIVDRLGWLDMPQSMKEQAGLINAFAKEIKSEQFRHFVLLGMGGSSLAPEVFQAACGNVPGYPELKVMDSTHPSSIADLSSQIDPKKTLFLVSSKSGTTLETLTLFYYFWKQVSESSTTPGHHFVAITDPGSSLVQLANDRQFRRIFLAPPEVGGRYSALSVFGMVPAALIGINIDRLLEKACRMAEDCGASVNASRNPGARLGAVLGEFGISGRDKITFVTSPSFSSLPFWLEQLVAESTGKEDKGLIPVAGEIIGSPQVYDNDRLFIGISLTRGDDQFEKLEALQSAGFPVLQFTMNGISDLGQEFFRWEFATAAASALLRINPFDQPDVQLAKDLARKAMESAPGKGKDSEDVISLSENSQLSQALRQWIESIQPGDYIALQAYLPQTLQIKNGLESLRNFLRDRLHVATTVGYGPRFLHSTGQLHKGGPNKGVFIQFTDRPVDDLAVPEKGYSFGALIRAQAEGDYQALKQRNRRIIRINLGTQAAEGLAEVKKLLELKTAD
jgi:transaldolase / glucose-6-phosphate isomerase